MSIPSELLLKLKCCAQNVPEPPTRAPAVDGMLKKLKVSDNVRDVMKDHIKVVGLDYRRFTRKLEDQGLEYDLSPIGPVAEFCRLCI
jgi:hypothetical protein